MDTDRRSWAADAARLAAAAALTFAAGCVSAEVVQAGLGVPVMPAPVGLPLLLGLLWGGRSMGVGVGAAAAAWACGAGPTSAALGGTACLVEAGFGWAAARGVLFPMGSSLRRPRDVFALAFGVCGPASLLAVTVLAGGLWAAGTIPDGNPDLVWAVGWLTTWLGDLVVVGAFFTWTAPDDGLPERGSRAERLAWAGLVLAVSQLALGGWFGVSGRPPFGLGLMATLAGWTAMRYGPRGVTLFHLAAAIIGTANAYAGVGPLADRAGTPDGLNLLSFACVVSLFVLQLAAFTRENRGALRRRYYHVLELEAKQRDLEQSNRRLRAVSGELRDETETVEAVLRRLPVGVLVVGAADGPTRGNDRLAPIFGRPFDPADFLPDGRPGDFAEVLCPEEDAPLSAAEWPLSKVLASGEEVRGAEFRVRRAGEVRTVRADAVPLRRPDGSPSAGILVLDDVTDRRRDEQRLRLLESVAVHAGEGVMIRAVTGLGADRRYPAVYANRAFCEMTGHAPDALRGGTVSPFAGEQPDPEAYPRARGAAASGAAAAEELYCYRADGSRFWAGLSVFPVPDAAGRPAHLVELVRDITVRKQTEERLMQANKLEAIGLLAGGVAHDFNNLLTAIQGNLSLVRLPPGDPNGAILNEANTAARRAAELTANLLSFARKRQLRVGRVDLAAAVGEAVAVLRRTIDPRIEIDVIADGAASAVWADPGQLQSVLFNLCLNARDAMPDGGRLALGTAAVELGQADVAGHDGVAPGRFVRLTVADTGTGMDEATRRRAFEPFFTTKEVGRGTGLGLAMVYGTVRQHRGFLEMETAPGRGTRFAIHLPAASGAAPEPAAPPAPGGALGEPAGRTVLVAEDERPVRLLARTILERHGYAVIEADDGAAAVGAFAADPAGVDLVLLDRTMPNLSGAEAFARMREVDPNVRVLFCSGYAADADADVGGAVGFLPKPYDRDRLLAAVRAALAADPVRA